MCIHHTAPFRFYTAPFSETHVLHLSSHLAVESAARRFSHELKSTTRIPGRIKVTTVSMEAPRRTDLVVL